MNISRKIQRVLTIFFIFFMAILLRIWHLGVIQREDRLIEAQKPQQRTILLRADRGAILDRFQIPMALNRISYNATIYYAQIAEIPRTSWGKDENGKQVRIFPRKEYIRKLAITLSKTLQLDADRVEDLIHSKAALFPHVPYIIKASLTEKEHYHLRMLEKDWPGIYAEIAQIRHYPMGKTACNIIGTMGAISPKEYSEIAQEISELQAAAEFYELDHLDRLTELKEKAYATTDLIGKTGIESEFEEELRGFFGKKTFEVDQKGRFLRELSEKKSIPGKDIVLSISSELQDFAERLLSIDERTRDGRSRGYNPEEKALTIQKQPWIKGGAIVVLDATTGEVLAMASHPRFDPNDFIFTRDSVFTEGKTKEINRWLENESFIASLWDGIDSLEREDVNLRAESAQEITLEFFLDTILPKEKPIRLFFEGLRVKDAIQIQEDYEAKLYFEKIKQKVPWDIQKRLERLRGLEKDQEFVVDLCRMLVYAPAFTDELIERIGQMPLSEYRHLNQQFLRKEYRARTHAKEHFRNHEFKAWREEHQKEFLKEKRDLEKENQTYAKPYIEYLDREEAKQFAAYWREKKFSTLRSPDMPEDLIRTFRSFSELNRPLLGKYRTLRNRKNGQLEKDLAASFYPIGGFGFCRSYAFESGVPPGSIFKLITAYEGLRQNHSLKMIDEYSKKNVGWTPNRKNPYPRYYKGGRLPRSAIRNMGEVDLLVALERSSNPYFSILAGDYFDSPEDLGKAARLFGYGELTGIDLPREKKGNISKDLKTNRTGLYSASIGQHTMLTTPLQMAASLSPIANKGALIKPKLVQKIVGVSPDRHPLGPFAATNYFAKDQLNAIGIPFPLFTRTQSPFEINDTLEFPTKIRRMIPMDERIRNPLIAGMDRVVWGTKGSARPNTIKALLANPILMKEYKELEHQMIGKTGTAEIVCRQSKNPSSPGEVYKYIWFGALSFKDTKYREPELAVVVFLRFGDSGKEAAPLASQMIHKWREIKAKHAALD